MMQAASILLIYCASESLLFQNSENSKVQYALMWMVRGMLPNFSSRPAFVSKLESHGVGIPNVHGVVGILIFSMFQQRPKRAVSYGLSVHPNTNVKGGGETGHNGLHFVLGTFPICHFDCLYGALCMDKMPELSPLTSQGRPFMLSEEPLHQLALRFAGIPMPHWGGSPGTLGGACPSWVRATSISPMRHPVSNR